MSLFMHCYDNVKALKMWSQTCTQIVHYIEKFNLFKKPLCLMENAPKQGRVTGASQRDESFWEQQPPENTERRERHRGRKVLQETQTQLPIEIRIHPQLCLVASEMCYKRPCLKYNRIPFRK